MLLLVLLAAGVYYYVTLPAVNIHSGGFWIFIIAVLALALFFYGGKNIRTAEEFKSNKILKLGIGVIVHAAVVFAAGSLLSSPIVNARKYRELIEPETGNFTEDIEQIRYDQIPILDKESAMLLLPGPRKHPKKISDFYQSRPLDNRRKYLFVHSLTTGFHLKIHPGHE